MKSVYSRLASGAIVCSLSGLMVVGGFVRAQAPGLEPQAVLLESVEWGPPGGGNGFPVGVRSAPQGTDSVTGGITYYALFPIGSHFDRHWHTHDEYVVVVQGRLTIELGMQTRELGVGSYVVIPGSLPHSWDVSASASEDAIILVRRGGPADFNFIKN